jgi:hemerythrin-like domain-containing protein
MAKKVTAKKTSGKRSAARKAAAAAATRRRKQPKKTAARKTTRSTASRRKTSSPARRKTSSTARRKTAARAAATLEERRNPTPSPRPSKLAVTATAVKGALAGAVAVVGDRLPWTQGDPDGLALLEQEHRRFEDQLKKGEETTERSRKGRADLLRTLTADLTAHELMEEQVLYPALKAHPEAKDIVLEGFQEHHVADILVKELHEVSTDDEQWGAKFKVLKESIEHHIGEEEGKMFRTARAVFTREELYELGSRMQKLRAGARRT